MNQIKISGIIDGPVRFEYFYRRERFFKFFINSKRLSGTADVLPCIVPEHVLSDYNYGDLVTIHGEIRSRRYKTDGKSHLEMYIYVTEIVEYEGKDGNDVELTGFITSQPLFHYSTRGKKITSILLAVHRKIPKSDYIPVIVWGRAADCASELPVGKQITIYGRFQSREYKKVVNDEVETRTAYEVSGSYYEESED